VQAEETEKVIERVVMHQHAKAARKADDLPPLYPVGTHPPPTGSSGGRPSTLPKTSGGGKRRHRDDGEEGGGGGESHKSIWARYIEGGRYDDDDLDDPPPRGQGKATLFECEFGCGFENSAESVVEAHEEQCPDRERHAERKDREARRVQDREALDKLLEKSDKTGSGYVGVYKTKGDKWLARVHLPKQCLQPAESDKCLEKCKCQRQCKDLGQFRTCLEAGRSRVKFLQEQPWSHFYINKTTGPVEEMPERTTDPSFPAWLITRHRDWESQRRARGIEPPSPDSPTLHPRKGRGRPPKRPKLEGDGRKRDRRWAHTKDPNAPKPPWNGYMFLTKECKPEMQAADPSLTLMDLGKVIGAKWRAMSVEEKKPFLDKASEDSVRYKREMDAYLLTAAGIAFLAEREAGREEPGPGSPPRQRSQQGPREPAERREWVPGMYSPSKLGRVVDGPMPQSYPDLEAWLLMQKGHWSDLREVKDQAGQATGALVSVPEGPAATPEGFLEWLTQQKKRWARQLKKRYPNGIPAHMMTSKGNLDGRKARWRNPNWRKEGLASPFDADESDEEGAEAEYAFLAKNQKTKSGRAVSRPKPLQSAQVRIPGHHKKQRSSRICSGCGHKRHKPDASGQLKYHCPIYEAYGDQWIQFAVDDTAAPADPGGGLLPPTSGGGGELEGLTTADAAWASVREEMEDSEQRMDMFSAALDAHIEAPMRTQGAVFIAPPGPESPAAACPPPPGIMEESPESQAPVEAGGSPRNDALIEANNRRMAQLAKAFALQQETVEEAPVPSPKPRLVQAPIPPARALEPEQEDPPPPAAPVFDVSEVPAPPGLIWTDADEVEVLASYDRDPNDEKPEEEEEEEEEEDAAPTTSGAGPVDAEEEEAEEGEEGEEPTWYVCEHGCGFESLKEAVVEKHESTCTFVESPPPSPASD